MGIIGEDMANNKGDKKEIASIKDIDNLWELIAYLVRYGMKELIIILLLIIIATYLALNISYNKKDGFQWNPAPIKIEYTR